MPRSGLRRTIGAGRVEVSLADHYSYPYGYGEDYASERPNREDASEGPQPHSDIKRPRQALEEHPRPTDHGDGNGREIDEPEEARTHSLTPKRADQLGSASNSTGFAG